MKRSELEKHIGESVEVKLFDGDTMQGVLRKADKLAAMTDKAKIFLYLNDKIKEALNELSDFEGMFKEEIKDEEGND